jgi:hypothetical protein
MSDGEGATTMSDDKKTELVVADPPKSIDLETLHEIICRIRQGLYVYRLKNKDSDALEAMSRTLDLARHAVGEQKGGRAFVMAVPDVLDLLEEGGQPREKQGGRESSITFKTEGGSMVRLTRKDAVQLAKVVWHYGKIVVSKASKTASYATGVAYIAHKILHELGLDRILHALGAGDF